VLVSYAELIRSFLQWLNQSQATLVLLLDRIMGPDAVDDNPRGGAMGCRIVPHAMTLEAMDGKCNPRLSPCFSFDSGVPMGEPVEDERARPELTCKPAVPSQREGANKIKKADMGVMVMR